MLNPLSLSSSCFSILALVSGSQSMLSMTVVLIPNMYTLAFGAEEEAGYGLFARTLGLMNILYPGMQIP